LRDSCLIKLADTIAADKSKVALDQGGLLVVKLTTLPRIDCE